MLPELDVLQYETRGGFGYKTHPGPIIREAPNLYLGEIP
jgi:hypothetical protein